MPLRQWMLFVDGENFTLQGQKILSARIDPVEEGPAWLRDVFLWLPPLGARARLADDPAQLQPFAVRAYYYTTAVGSGELLDGVRMRLRGLDFDPNVFAKDKRTGRTKGVDITLATDMLSHAFRGHYDAAVLVAGDGDYLPLVREVKRLGKFLTVAFFDGPDTGLSPAMKLEADYFFDLTHLLISRWGAYMADVAARKR